MIFENELFSSRAVSILTNGEVPVWHASLGQPREVLMQLEAVLSQEEKVRARRFRFERHRNYFVVGRGILRILLSKYTGIGAGQLQLQYTQHGKPFLSGITETGICFNLSHSGDRVIYAFSRGSQIGIDIEHIRPVEDVDQIAKRSFSPREYHTFRSVPEADRWKAFFNCWTRKEAFIKAIGEGLSFPLEKFEVSLEPGCPAALISVMGSLENAKRWSMYELQTHDGYVAALAVKGNGHSISHRWIDSVSNILDGSML
jgi:4'-phosphopantetheinyl transferase